MPKLTDFLDVGHSTGMNVYLFAMGLIYVRCLIVISLTPFLGAKPVPNNVKGALSLVLVFFIFPLVLPNLHPENMPESTAWIMMLIFKEALFAFILGFVVNFIFQGFQAAGSVIDNQRSVANARIFNPALGAQTSVFGNYYYWLALSYFIMVGGHHLFISGFIKSFQTIPLLEFPQVPTVFGPNGDLDPLLSLLIKISADTLIMAMQIAAPVVIAIFIADLVLGLMNRIAPMVNVFEMGFNLKGFVGVLLVTVSIPLLMGELKHWYQNFFDAMRQMTFLFFRK